MDLPAILKLIYRTGVNKVGKLSLTLTNEVLYAILALTPEQLVRQEWSRLNATELRIYRKNEVLIKRSQWGRMDVSCHNLLFILVSKRLRIDGKGLEPTLEENIRLIVTLRNNEAHDSIQEIVEIKRKSSKVALFNARFVKDELKNIIDLCNVVFGQLRTYFTANGKTFPEPKGDKILTTLNWLIKSVDVPNFLIQNVKDFENKMHKEISKLEHISKDLESNMLKTENVTKALERVTSQQETNVQTMKKGSDVIQKNTLQIDNSSQKIEERCNDLERHIKQQEAINQQMMQLNEEIQANVKKLQDLNKTREIFEHTGSFEIVEEYDGLADPKSEKSIILKRKIEEIITDAIKREDKATKMKFVVKWFTEGSVIVNFHMITAEENEMTTIELVKKIIRGSGVKGLLASSIIVKAMTHSSSKPFGDNEGPSGTKIKGSVLPQQQSSSLNDSSGRESTEEDNYSSEVPSDKILTDVGEKTILEPTGDVKYQKTATKRFVDRLSDNIDGGSMDMKACNNPSVVDCDPQGVELSGDKVDIDPQYNNLPEAQQVVSHDDPFYKMNHPKRGFAIIFKHERYDDPEIPTRDCATEDANNCTQTFTDLGFKVEVYEDLGKHHFLTTLSEIRKRKELSECDSLAIIFMSHGSVDGNQEYIMLRDERVPTSTLWTNFTGENCLQLAGKPIFIFIQACRGIGADKGIVLKALKGPQWVDDCPAENEDYVIPKHSDMLVMWSTYPGMLSFRKPSGSVFIQYLCKILSRDHTTEDLSSMLLTITRHVAIHYKSNVPPKTGKRDLDKMKQLPYTVSTLMRKVVFGQQEDQV